MINLKIGYIRVSTVEQNIARQEVIMKKLDVEKIFIDKISGKNKERPMLKEMMDFVRSGDIVVVESISRFARNTRDLLELVDQLVAKGVQFVSMKEKIDTSTPSGKFMLTVFGAVAQLERDYILQRQKEGIAIAKANGKYQGRKKIQNDRFDEIYEKWKNNEITATQAMKLLNFSKTTFYRRVKEMKENEEKS
mgnify:FL=1